MTPTQLSPRLTSLRSFYLLAKHYGIDVPAHKLAMIGEENTIIGLIQLMRECGFEGKQLIKRSWKDLTKLGSAYPVMAEYKSGGWVILVNVAAHAATGESIAVLDPTSEHSGVQLILRRDFEKLWSGRILLCRRAAVEEDKPQPFGISWFLPEILRNARSYRDVAMLSTLSSLVSLSTPLMFNIMVDKVVPHRSFNTLYAVLLCFGIVTLFEAVFGYVRAYLMMYAGNKIDARLASRAFAKLLTLPMDFFESQPVGVLLRNIQQTESVRGFITGRLFFTALDLISMPILIVVLLLYSGILTLVVACFGLAMASVIALMVPVFKRKLSTLYAAEGDRQADLVETIHGMRAVKSLALEDLRQSSWDGRVARSIQQRNHVGHFTIGATTFTGLLSTAMTYTLLGVGVSQVFAGNMSLGGLIAFNMLSGRVTGPLMQVVALINEYQQVSIALRVLGGIMDHPPERDPTQKTIAPPITGELSFSNVSFHYKGAVTPALDRVSFSVEEGKFIGVVGRSGSGKTTLTRLIQGLHNAQSGLIQLNGTDIRHMDLGHLRRNIGVVLQDSILFRGTIRENIAAANPEASLEEVIEVARLAGAEEFIAKLPHSYETRVEESATNFSGGQRQRLAIARALLLKPKLLLFDEATSALDPESEAIIQQNLEKIADGRTLIVVSHRLSSLVNADLILVMDNGKVVDYAPHATLLERCEVYCHLWDQQTRFVK